MTDLIMPRRKLLTGLLGLVAAPAVVKATSLMPVKVITPEWKYTEVGYSYLITRDNEPFYSARFGEPNAALIESFQRTKEIYMHNTLQNIFGRIYQ